MRRAGTGWSFRSPATVSETTFCILSPVKTVAALTRHCRTPAPPQVRAGDHQLPQYLWGRRRPPWSTRGRLEQDFRASLRDARDARTAPSRLPITDHLPSLYAPSVVRSGEQRAGTWGVQCRSGLVRCAIWVCVCSGADATTADKGTGRRCGRWTCGMRTRSSSTTSTTASGLKPG